MCMSCKSTAVVKPKPAYGVPKPSGKVTFGKGAYGTPKIVRSR